MKNMVILRNLPSNIGEISIAIISRPPAENPEAVILLGLPPKASIFSLI